MFKDIAELRQQIKAFGLERHEEKLLVLAKPAIRMLPTRVEDSEIPIGASKLGGNPDLPPDFEWQYYNGKPLTFIGQFKLSEIAPYDRDKELPAQGMLYFFYDIIEMADEFGSWQIAYLEAENSILQRKIHPRHEHVYKTIEALPSHRLNFESRISLPIGFENEKKDYDFTEDEHKQYWELYNTNFPEPRHSLLGYDSHIQSNSRFECAMLTRTSRIAEIKAERGDSYRVEDIPSLEVDMMNWKFLFQIDSDKSLDVMWGDLGMLYVCIRKDRLATKSFDKSITLMQCS